jgi:hypothetical protein
MAQNTDDSLLKRIEGDKSMPIQTHSAAKEYRVPGVSHQTLAGPEHGMKTLEMWMQTLEPGSA